MNVLPEVMLYIIYQNQLLVQMKKLLAHHASEHVQKKDILIPLNGL